MCGRFVIELTPEMLYKVFGLQPGADWPARYNIAPTQAVPVIRQLPAGNRQLTLLRWGLVPFWAKEMSRGMINARVETVSEKASFRQAFRQRRCILPASGFYEWQKEGARKLPHYIHMADRGVMPFAGIWDAWKSPTGEVIETCAILTTAANATVAKLHDRMPVILKPEAFAGWLDPSLHDPARLHPLLAPCPDAALESYPVSPLVNSPANDSRECIKEYDG